MPPADETREVLLWRIAQLEKSHEEFKVELKAAHAELRAELANLRSAWRSWLTPLLTGLALVLVDVLRK